MTAGLDGLEDRHRCAAHVARRAAERGLDIDAAARAGLERMCAILAPAYEVPGVRRYRLRVRLDGRRLVVVYDRPLGVLVTVWGR